MRGLRGSDDKRMRMMWKRPALVEAAREWTRIKTEKMRGLRGDLEDERVRGREMMRRGENMRNFFRRV